MSKTIAASEIPRQFGAEGSIAFTQVGSTMDVRLTRPKALNALTHQMVLALHAGLQVWRNDDAIAQIVVSADTGDKRAFCAGGDIRDLYTGFHAGNPRHSFFQDEYRLNEAISSFPKPYISLLDGMVMGGGAGISMHGSHRIVTENTRFAMPEVGIGLIPDVGGSYILPRLENLYGIFLGLTGITIGAEECLQAGIASHFCPANDIDALRAELLSAAIPAVVLINLRQSAKANLLAENAPGIVEVCSASTLGQLLGQLEKKAEEQLFFANALKRMKAASPLSLCLAFELLKLGEKLSLRQCLVMEYRLVSRILLGPDLYEGIRAAIIDRSVPPKWQPESPEAVDSVALSSFFNAPAEGDLVFET